MNILDLIPEEDRKQKSDGNWQMECPDCGLQGGRTEGFILFPDTNSAYCQSSQKNFDCLTLAGLKSKIIKCLDGRESGDFGSGISDEAKKEILEKIKEDFGNDVYFQLKDYAGLGDSNLIKNVDVEENETEIELTESKESVNFDFLTKNILRTQHLENYNLLDSDLGLDGESYDPFKKCLWYYHHSLMQPTVSYKINKKTHIDNRKHILGITAPSGGKSTTKNQIKRILDSKDVIEVAGLSHPEQLVGKVTYKGKGENKRPVEKLGIMSYKCVINDEAQDMLNEKNDIYAKAQRIRRISMDTYGDNTISKKLVDDSKEDVLKYDPECRCIDFAHPEKMENAFFATGSFRRPDIFNLTYETILNINDIADFKLDDKYTQKENYPEALATQYKKKRVETKFNQQTLDIISYYHKSVLHFLLKHKNQNAFRYALLTRYSLRNNFCKNVLILAISKNEKVPSLDTTIHACTDSLLFILKSIEAINELGDMGLCSDVWGGLCEQDAQVLEFLLRKGAITKDESNVSIQKFWTILGHIYGCRITQARGHFYRLKKDGFVDSKRASGEGKSKVWLKFVPKEVKIESEEENPVEFWKKHLVTVGHKRALLTLTKNHFTDDKKNKILATVGSVGVWGCTLINEYICVEALYKNKNNNIYTNKDKTLIEEYPKSPTVPTLTKKKKNLKVKTIKTTVKTAKNRPTVTKKVKTDRETQFYETLECESIRPNHSKEDILEWIKANPKYKAEELYDKLGVGSLKFRNELKREGLI
jgi:hypothetical protein